MRTNAHSILHRLLRLSFCLLVVAIFIAGESTCQAQRKIGHARCCGRQDVIVIRGGAGYWPGAQDMANHFASLGYVPTIIQHWEYATVADEIAQATREGRMAGGVVIVGYSSGADAACSLAGRLEKKGVRVQTMVLIESTFGMSVPANVDYCVNYYQSRKLDFIPAFRGIPVAAKGSSTQLYNVNVAHNAYLQHLTERNHFTICNTPTMRQMAGDVVASRQPAVVPGAQEAIATNSDNQPTRR